MKAYYTDHFVLPLPEGHRFPMAKYARLQARVALPDQTTDTTYLDRLAEALPRAIEASGPELAIYVSGADPYDGDRLGRLAR